MSTVSLTRTLDAPATTVWPLLADFGGVHAFHPYVDRSPLLNAVPEGPGAERQCVFYDGNAIKERVVSWEPGRQLVVDIVEGSMPLATARATLEVEPVDDGTCRFTMTMDYTPKWGLVGQAMDALMMRRKFQQMVAEVTTGLELHATTGRRVGQGMVLEDAVAAAK